MDQILIVDDQALFRQAMRLGLSAEQLDRQLEPIEASNGLEALDAVRKNPNIRFAVVDVFMPVMTGIEFVRKFHEEMPDRFRDCRIFMITTEGNRELRAEMRQLGVVAWLIKPVDPRKFCQALKAKYVKTTSASAQR